MNFKQAQLPRPSLIAGPLGQRPTPMAAAIHGVLLSLAIGAGAIPALAQAQVASTALPAGAAVRAFNVPAGPLDVALDRFARAAGVNLSYDAALIADLTTKGLTGNFSVAAGLPVLLAGSGVEAVAQSGGGYLLRKAPVPVSSGHEATLSPVQVTASSTTLPGELRQPYAGGQVARGGSLGLLGTSDIMDVPFSTTNYTSELIANQQARSLADVVINEASGRVLTSSGGFGEDFQIRGFTVPSGDVGLNGLYGLASGSRLPAEIVERAEVLRGPGSLINGIAPNGSIGGGINVVTKRAADEPLSRLTTTYMSDSQFGTHLDLGRRFGEDNAWGVRFNGVWRDGEASIDNGNQQLGLAALAVDYRGSRLRWSLDAFTQHEDIDEFRPQIGLASSVTSIPTPPSSSRNFYPGSNVQLRDSTVASRIEYDLSDALTAYAGIGYRDGSAEQIFPVTTAGADAQGNFTVRGTYYDSYSKTTSVESGLRARFATAGIGHTLTLGVSGLQQEAGNAYVAGTATVVSNIYNPAPLPGIAATRTSPSKASDTTLSSVALADTLSFANDRVLLTLGLRDQTVEMENFNTATGASTSRYKASAVAPLAGIVFKPLANVSLYGNYTDGLTRGQIVAATYANAGEVLAPYKSEQYEAGVKVDWGTLTTGASVFQIERPNGQADAASNTYGYDGEQRNRGLELSAYGELQRGLRVMASAAFNDARLTSTAGGLNQGKDAPGVPDRTFSLGADWDTPWDPQLSLNGRAIYTSSTYFNAANTLRIDGWTRYDVGARYRTAMAGKPLVLRASIENLFDENKWLMSGTYLTVSAPRTLVLSASIDF